MNKSLENCDDREVVNTRSSKEQSQPESIQFENFCNIVDAVESATILHVRSGLADDTPIKLEIRCVGVNGANKFVRLSTTIVGCRKICSGPDSDQCFYAFEVNGKN